MNKYKHNQGWAMNNNNQQTTEPISDDQELTEALAGVNGIITEAKPAAPAPKPADGLDPIIMRSRNSNAPMDEPVSLDSSPVADFDLAGILENIKKDALVKLRPLIDNLNLIPEEKFDIYLLILRSTDDKTIIAPAYEAAQGIEDEARRAQAILDIIKEIDYLSNNYNQLFSRLI